MSQCSRSVHLTTCSASNLCHMRSLEHLRTPCFWKCLLGYLVCLGQTSSDTLLVLLSLMPSAYILSTYVHLMARPSLPQLQTGTPSFVLLIEVGMWQWHWVRGHVFVWRPSYYCACEVLIGNMSAKAPSWSRPPGPGSNTSSGGTIGAMMTIPLILERVRPVFFCWNWFLPDWERNQWAVPFRASLKIRSSHQKQMSSWSKGPCLGIRYIFSAKGMLTSASWKPWVTLKPNKGTPCLQAIQSHFQTIDLQSVWLRARLQGKTISTTLLGEAGKESTGKHVGLSSWQRFDGCTDHHGMPSGFSWSKLHLPMTRHCIFPNPSSHWAHAHSPQPPRREKPKTTRDVWGENKGAVRLSVEGAESCLAQLCCAKARSYSSPLLAHDNRDVI